MTKVTAGILAHVDAGKTTLSEAMLYHCGVIRSLGRVDRGDAFLDTNGLEKARGITIFSKQAILTLGDREVTLLDTPGHVDFSAEMERTLQVLDYAVLLVSGSEGVQAHTETLWRLLSRYGIPVFVFVNKMDLTDRSQADLIDEMKRVLGGSFVDFTEDDTEEFFENAATCGEAELEEFLETGSVDAERLRAAILRRDLVPCFFGSALKDTGVAEFLQGLEKYMVSPAYGEAFAAKVYKIERDSDGKRMTFMKLTGGNLSVRDEIDGEKVSGIRIYSGEKFRAVTTAEAGTVCAVLGLTSTRPGMGLGEEKDSELPVLEPVMTYRLMLPEEMDAAKAMPKLREVEEEIPELHMVWDEEKKEIHAQIMGAVQMEILQSILPERLGCAVRFGERSIVYRETINDTVEGVGHFEPLRHYAEVHLLMEPSERGSGLTFADDCSTDTLATNWHRLILTHLAEREHRGVLIGAPITDIKITLVSGRAHIKHTEGGDFRQAVYRAVRQGLMQAESVLLEPWYNFRLEIPETYVGRAMTDLGRMEAKFEMPVQERGLAIIAGRAPVSTIDPYQAEVIAYTAGRGRLICSAGGYDICHNPEEVLEQSAYDPELDLRNPTGSVFCTHGAGFYVPWNEVKDYMHLESCFSSRAGQLKDTADVETAALTRQGGDERARSGEEVWLGTEEIDAILDRTYNANRKPEEGAGRNRWGARRKKVSDTETVIAAKPAGTGSGTGSVKKPAGPKYLLVDGYNTIFAWPELNDLAQTNIDSARDRLLDIMCNYQGYTKYCVIVVFDAYRVQGHNTEYFDYRNIHVVYTKTAETADQYIEKFSHEHAKRYDVTVATSDGLEQIIVRSQNAAVLSARDLMEEMKRTDTLIRENIGQKELGMKNRPFEGIISPETGEK